MLPYQVLIFDFDGTLCDTHASIQYTFKKAFEQQGVKPPSPEKIMEGLATGANLWEMLPLLYPELQKDEKKPELEEWVKLYRHLYDTDGGRFTTLFGGAEDLCKEIKKQGLACAVISNKGQQAIEDALQNFGLISYFDLVIGDNPAKPMKKKPAPEAFLKVIQPYYPQIPQEQFLMIGDTHADLEFANNAGIESCWAAYGYGDRDRCLATKPKYTIQHLSQLLPILQPAG